MENFNFETEIKNETWNSHTKKTGNFGNLKIYILKMKSYIYTSMFIYWYIFNLTFKIKKKNKKIFKENKNQTKNVFSCNWRAKSMLGRK